MKNSIFKKIYIALFVVGLALLSINLFGLFIPLKNPSIYKQSTGFKKDITLTTEETLAIIDQPITDKKEYVRKVNEAINKGILHYWTGEHEKDYNVILPFYENYILYLLARTPGYKSVPRHEFCDYKKTIERGVGFCSQVSIALADILNKKNIHTNVIAWPQHTITEVEIDKNKWWTVDPDYGVVIEHKIDEIAKNPNLIKEPYKKHGYTENNIQGLMEIYSSPNRITYRYDEKGFGNCNTTRKFKENLYYILIWIIPLILMMPLFLLKIRKNEK
jgi:hypothetical protein